VLHGNSDVLQDSSSYEVRSDASFKHGKSPCVLQRLLSLIFGHLMRNKKPASQQGHIGTGITLRRDEHSDTNPSDCLIAVTISRNFP
jgi:hypothetical protein